jgi:hypothetical protein
LHDLLFLLHLEPLQVNLVLETHYLGLILQHDIVPVDQLPRTRVKLVVQDRLLVQHLPVLGYLRLVHTLTLSQLLFTVRIAILRLRRF